MNEQSILTGRILSWVSSQICFSCKFYFELYPLILSYSCSWWNWSICGKLKENKAKWHFQELFVASLFFSDGDHYDKEMLVLQVQLAKLAGCHVIGTCSTDAKGEFLKVSLLMFLLGPLFSKVSVTWASRKAVRLSRFRIQAWSLNFILHC